MPLDAPAADHASAADGAIRWLRAEIAGPARSIPLPASGKTLTRWRYLAAVASDDLSHARLVEGHLDALAILTELGHPEVVAPDRIYAVWAADPTDLKACRSEGGWRLTGSKRYCSGSIGVDVALITATAPTGPRLFLLGPSDIARLDAIAGSWPSVGMAATASATLHFDLHVDDDSAVGGPDAYVQRRGFWAGAAGVATCWLGGAAAVIDTLADDPILADDPGAARAIGSVRSRLDAAGALARETAALVDDADIPIDDIRTAALGLRSAVGEAARAALAVDLDVAGTRLLCLDHTHSQRFADLSAYLTQLAAGTAADFEAARSSGPSL